MTQPERQHPPRPQPNRPAEDPSSESDDHAATDHLRAASARLFERADQIDSLIKTNLSLDSTRTLRATRQASGQ